MEKEEGRIDEELLDQLPFDETGRFVNYFDSNFEIMRGMQPVRIRCMAKNGTGG